MAVSYPSSVKSFTPLVDNTDYPQATQVNQIYDELTALEQALLSTGLAHDLKFVDATYDIGKSGATRPRDLFLSRNATIGGTATVTGGQIVFPATQVPSAGANTFDDYEEGTYTPADGSGAGLTFAVATGSYIKIGRMVYFTADVTYPVTANGAAAAISVPIAVASTPTSQAGGAIITYTNVGLTHTAYVPSAITGVLFFATDGSAVVNASYSGKIVRLMGMYLAAN